jgi:hypothetical protein
MGNAAQVTTTERRFLRRRQAAEYLQAKYGFGAVATLAKGAVTGDTPCYHKVGGGRIVLYTREALDEWALARWRSIVLASRRDNNSDSVPIIPATTTTLEASCVPLSSKYAPSIASQPCLQPRGNRSPNSSRAGT